MKKLLAVIALLLVTAASWASSDGIEVWGKVRKANDGQYYLTMYKNCPVQVTARFHFQYRGGGISQNYDLFMADSIAELHDPVPVEKAVRKVVIEDLYYTATNAEGEPYTTSDPDDPQLNILLLDLFDIYSDIVWSANSRQWPYYSHRHAPSGHRTKLISEADDLDLKELDSDDLLLGIAAVAVAGFGMGIMASQYWDVEDSRYPYFSISPQVQYFFDSEYMRDVFQFKYRFGNKGGWSLFADFGMTQGLADKNGQYRKIQEMNIAGIEERIVYKEQIAFDSGFTWSIGAGLDIGNFSLSINGKPAFYTNDDNFCAAQLGYDFQISDHIGIGLKAGAAVLSYKGKHYLDYPANLGVFWRF